MTPEKLAKSGTEHGHQAALFAYVAVAYRHGFDVADQWSKTGKLPLATEPAAKGSTVRQVKPPAVPALAWFHAIHNQGHGDAVRGAKAKAEGVRKGVADTFLPWPVWTQSREEFVIAYCGLYIEMKKPSERPKTDKSKGGLSDEQIEFCEYAKNVGYGWAVCYGWEHAVANLRSYIEWGLK